jgi:hypothetical protein
MSSTAITTPAPKLVTEYEGLREDNTFLEAVQANLGGGSLRQKDLTWVKIPAGGNVRWQWTAGGNDHFEKAITGLCVVVGQIEYNLWPKKDSERGTFPYLRSLDGETGYQIGDDYGTLPIEEIEAAKRPDGTYDWKAIPCCQWQGTGRGAKPPRAKSTRVVGILRKSESVPVFIRLAPTSLKPLDDFLRGLAASGVPHYAAEVELGLEKIEGGQQDYSRVTCRHSGTVTREEAAVARTRFTIPWTPIVKSSVDRVEPRDNGDHPF